ncbi:SGNH/GDSL hydrolase family protein, partial [Rhodobacterales bacterium HKCCE2091]|nr:SGNH/GDSL hydrolase family protein [Rhodobacterales bacterium HKCCE2091]
MPRARRWLLAAVLVLALLEAGLRWGVGLGQPVLARLDPVTEYELIGPAEYRRRGNRIAINSLGMRAGEPGQGPRILLVGDSVVYGGTELDQSETIAARLDAALAACGAQALPVAVSSWGPVNQAAWLRREGVQDARAAALVVSAHDLHDVPRPGETEVPD